MNSRIVLLAGSTIAFLSSCFTYKEISNQSEFENYINRKSVHVLKVITKSDSLFFSKKMPAKMMSDHISGFQQFPLEQMKKDSVFFKNSKYKRVVVYVYKDGIRYDVVEHNDQIYVFNSSLPLAIPYSETASLYLKIYEPGRTAALIAGSSLAYAGLIILAVLSMTFDMGMDLM